MLIRCYCVWAFVDAAFTLVGLPADIYGMLNARSDYFMTQWEIALAMLLARFLIYAGTGVAFLMFARPIARFLTRGFDQDTSA